jgi:signal transduction histidine kinase
VAQGTSRLDLQLLGLAALALASAAAAAALVVRGAAGFHWTGPLGLAVGFVALCALSAVGSYVVVGRARTALRRRTRAMREVARELGGGDLTVTLPEGEDDLGSLARSMNAMSARIARLLQAQRDLLSGVSHELRSPLARISVALELIEMGRAEGDPELTELVEGVREEVTLLERHISRLLEAQRVSSRRVLLKRRPLVLDELVASIVARERNRLDRLGWRHHLELAADHAEVLGDENALDRVISTLIENAIQHAGPRGEDAAATPETARFTTGGGPDPAAPKTSPSLRVQTGIDAGGLYVRVMDRGPGLTAEQCAAAFEPFARIDSSRSSRTGGTGLGLYLARTICEAHGGSASAHPRPGGGLVVELRLPRRGQKDLKETMRVSLDAGLLEQLRQEEGA